MYPRITAALFALFLLLPAASSSAQYTRVDYEALQSWRFGSSGITVPSEGLTFAIDDAVWTLESGTIRYMEPVNDQVTGLIFSGSGTMTMEVPDPVEVMQLRRFTGDASLRGLELHFTDLVLRSSHAPLLDMAPGGGQQFSSDRVASERHDTWIEITGLDPDARIISALTSPGDQFSIIDMKTAKWDWIRYTWDEKEVEEIEVVRLDRRYPEIWLSLDRREDRLPDGRPSKTYDARAHVEHIDVIADLTRRGRGSTIGKSRTNPILASFITTVRTIPQTTGMGSLHFTLHPYAEVDRVVSTDGEPLEFLRDHIGKRAFSLDNELYDADIVVLLDSPTQKGEPVELTFEYELEIANYVSGNSWYPTIADNYLNYHTAELTLTAPRKYEVYSMGEKIDTRSGGEGETTVWRIETPTPMVTFSVGDDFKKKEIAIDDAPNVIAFGPVMGFGRRNMIHNVGADVANSIRFFEWLFDHPLPNEELYVTSIAAGHGQAFNGFLHMSEGTFDSEHPGASELFRAHEVAHQWWGHEVGWKTYRDQWLSESFAEYAAMMFVQSTMEHGDKLFDEILDVYTNMLNGSLRGAFSKFYRPWLLEMNESYRGRLGPIDVGRRAGTAEIPAGYIVQSYYKGPLVIHMLRVMLKNQTRSEDAFIAILRDFVATHAGGKATTEDFERILQKHYPGDWSWFFKQWVYSAEIPTLEYDVDMPRAPNAAGNYVLTIRVRKSDVPGGFVTPVPIRVELDGGQVATITAVVRQEEQTFDYELPARPRKVDFNADKGILANVRKM